MEAPLDIAVFTCENTCYPLQVLPQEGIATPDKWLEGDSIAREINCSVEERAFIISSQCLELVIASLSELTEQQGLQFVEVDRLSARLRCKMATTVELIAWEFSENSVRAELEVGVWV